MGIWNTSIKGNDTAQDLYTDYTAAFYKYCVEEALIKIDEYVRKEMCDESDSEEWCNYYYSLADFMWKKGILTDSVRNKAIEMIDNGFGLEIWEEAGEKILNDRKKVLAAFKDKLASPQPPKKKIKPSAHLERIFENGDIIAVQLQTTDKPYTESKTREISEEEFRSLDGKFVIMQLVDCYASWKSAIVPEVKDYWAYFRLFDGIFDEIPEGIDISSLKLATIKDGPIFASEFTCESSMFYFKKRKFKLLGNRKDLVSETKIKTSSPMISWGINKPWLNPDSVIVSSMGKEVICDNFKGNAEQMKSIYTNSNRCGRFNYSISKEENERIFSEEENLIARRIEEALSKGGEVFGVSFGREIGFVTVQNGKIDNLFVEGWYQNQGYGTQLLKYAISCIDGDAYIDIPKNHSILLHICEKLGFEKIESNDESVISMVKDHNSNQ